MSLSDGELSEKEVRSIVREELDNWNDDGTSRRTLLKALGVAGAGAALGGGSSLALTGQASAASHAGDIGAPNDRYDFYGRVMDTEQLSNAPIVFSSGFASYQAAVDTAAGGTLLIDDTKTEEGIVLGTAHNGTTIQCVGDNWIEQPASPTTHVISDNGAAKDLTFVDLQVRNPNLTDADIGNEDTLTSRYSAVEATGWVRPTFVRPRVHHVNGYGIALRQPEDRATIRDGHVSQTGYDSYYVASTSTANPGATVDIDGCYSEDAGRHNFAIAGDAVEDAVHISGVGKRAYTAGVDLEHAGPTRLDVELIDPSQSGGSTSVDAGLNQSGTSKEVAGTVRVINPGNYAANISAAAGRLEIASRRTDGAAQNPNDTIPIELNATGGEAEIHCIVDGGGSTNGAVRAITANGYEVHVIARNVYGPALAVNRCDKCRFVVASKEPANGGTAVASGKQAHVYLVGTSGNNSLDNDIELIGRDSNGNATYGVSSGGNTDWSRISGNVRGAYSATSALNGLGANSDTADLIT